MSKKLELKTDFETFEQGTKYRLPNYKVVDGKGIEKSGTHQIVKFVRGSKLKGEDVEKREGILHETLLKMMIEDLKFKNELVPSREGSLTITKLEEALHWLWQRQLNRKQKGTQGTYQK